MAQFRLRDGTGTIKLRYLVEDMDRHGNVRLYVRRKGHPKVRLAETPGTPAFLEEYRAALAAGTVGDRSAQATRQPRGKKGGPPQGTLGWLCQQYFACDEFQSLHPSTRGVRRNILNALCKRAGDLPVASMQAEHIRQARNEKATTPHAANNLVKTLRQMFAVAVDKGWVVHNPAKDIAKLKTTGDGHHSWAPEEIQRFEAHHPVGTRARLAMALLLYTGQRRSDVVRMGPQHVRDGWLTITQAKNATRHPVTVSIPILPALQQVLDASETGHLAYLITKDGKPYSVAGFGNTFRDWCNEAGLSHCSAHGLRKATAARLAELGASEHEIMSITGHKTLQEVARYTRAARQKVLAKRAMDRLSEEHESNKSVPPSGRITRSGTKPRSK
ncbi:tyrosine-type recombinase/integrase [Nitrospirillum iridis]|uniref:Integrase n=1 Tax=Nitrospirillum iridis TaxID=765888 RepID=A0A7X0B3B7_9PROT|nr:tyrosine-type recombinase/integrase [Nitrospirillum iridis]MBB6254960.1 integrase [Nitrospirillum iridis]